MPIINPYRNVRVSMRHAGGWATQPMERSAAKTPKHVALRLTMQRASENKVNHDLIFTLDLRGVDNNAAIELLETASAYGVQDIAVYGADPGFLLAQRAGYFPSLRALVVERQHGESASSGDYIAIFRGEDNREVRSAYVLPAFKVQKLAAGLGVSEEAVCLVEGHMSLGRNYLVSGSEEVTKLAHKYFRRGQQHLIEPSQLTATITRLQRRLGKYYIAPSHTITPRSFYYRELMLAATPAYQPMWSTAVFGIEPANLEPNLMPFAGSLDHRATSLLQVSDDLEEQAHEAADNAARWEMLNLLQYFAMLATGLFDNIAWLAAIRYGFYREYMDVEANRNFVALRIRKDPNGGLMPNRFHYRVQAANRGLYDLMVSAQDLMDVLYPVRDSVQHRLVLSTTIWENRGEGWKKVLIGMPPESLSALQRIEATAPGSLRAWGYFPSSFPDRPFIEPSTFAKKAVADLFAFVQRAIELMDFPALLASYPDLQIKVLQPRERP